MKVLHLSTEDVSGGAGIAAYRLHQGLKRSGVESTMLVWRKDSDDQDVIEAPRNSGYFLSNIGSRIEHRCIAANCDKGQQRHGGVFPGYAARMIREIDPDIVNLHLVNRGMISIGQIGRLELPVVWTFHDMWAITSGYYYYGDKLSPELVAPEGGFDPDVGSNLLTRWLLRKKCRAWQGLDLEIVCPSKWLQSASGKSPTVGGKKIHHIPNGLDLEVFQPKNKSAAREALGLPVDKKLILFGAASSADDPRKGSDLLLKALQEGIKKSFISASDTELVSFGHQHKLPEALKGMKMHNMGRISGDEALAQIYSSVDVFVAPSREDNLPNTVLEAMACGIPTVAFRIGGMPDMIEHRSTGYLAEPYDTLGLAQGIAYVIEQVSSADVRQRAVQYYALERQAANYTEIYEKMLRKATHQKRCQKNT